MVESCLVAHCGARFVERAELEHIEAPPPTATWFPLKHVQVLDRVTETLSHAGFAVQTRRLALSRNDARFFGTLDLATPVVNGVTLSVGIRNSCDKSFPIAFCAGRRVFVCDNLAFHSEITVARKHTRFGEARFNEAIAKAVQSLHQFKAAEAARITRFQLRDVTETEADAILLRSFEQGIVSYRLLPEVIRMWRKPAFEEFEPRTLWSLENAFTSVLGEVAKVNPQRFCRLTMAVQHLIGHAAGIAAEPALAQAA